MGAAVWGEWGSCGAGFAASRVPVVSAESCSGTEAISFNLLVPPVCTCGTSSPGALMCFPGVLQFNTEVALLARQVHRCQTRSMHERQGGAWAKPEPLLKRAA